MRQQDALQAFASWVDAGLVEAEWAEPLTLSLRLTGARALALGSRTDGSNVELLGWSLGAPAEFLSFCRELSPGAGAHGVQERPVVGLGKICWASTLGRGGATVLFAFYDRDTEASNLRPIADMAQKCVTARAKHETSGARTH